MKTAVLEKEVGCDYEPLNDYVLVERVDEETGSKIVIPENAKEKSNKARVIAVGEGRVIGGIIVPINLQAGDIVLITKYGAEDIELDGQKLALVRAAEVKLKLR